MILKKVLLIISIVFLSSTLYGQKPIEVSDNFESGSLGEWRIEDDTRLVLIPRTDFD